MLFFWISGFRHVRPPRGLFVAKILLPCWVLVSRFFGKIGPRARKSARIAKVKKYGAFKVNLGRCYFFGFNFKYLFVNLYISIFGPLLLVLLIYLIVWPVNMRHCFGKKNKKNTCWCRPFQEKLEFYAKIKILFQMQNTLFWSPNYARFRGKHYSNPRKTKENAHK